MSISSILINWYLQNKRNLPWRNSENPYHIWVSEIILQQTRVAQGMGYYHHFLQRFPTIESIANAELEDVLRVWQGLGYYSRARNFHEGAKYVLQQYDGLLPPKYEELIKIKGIGEYTAAAIGSFAFNLAIAVVDGNVNRFLARFYGIHDPINSTTGVNKIKKIARSILDVENPGTHNQAIMEFGALQCTILKPDCSLCPLSQNCFALKHNEVSILPVKIKPSKVRQRYFNYLVIQFNHQSYLVKRSEKDIWLGLYEFPLIETSKQFHGSELTQTAEWESIFKYAGWKILQVSPIYNHKLTHQTINTLFYVIEVDQKLTSLEKKAFLVEKQDLGKYPVSKLMENYISLVDL